MWTLSSSTAKYRPAVDRSLARAFWYVREDDPQRISIASSHRCLVENPVAISFDEFNKQYKGEHSRTLQLYEYSNFDDLCWTMAPVLLSRDSHLKASHIVGSAYNIPGIDQLVRRGGAEVLSNLIRATKQS